MEKLFDETFPGEDDGRASRNVWYGYIELYKESEYGKEMLLTEEVANIIYEIVKSNLSEDIQPSPTETNWYLYGKTVTQDAVGGTIRPSVMIREKEGAFLVRCNISDLDFAVNIDKIILFESNLENHLRGR